MLFVETMGPTASMESRIWWVSCCRDIVLIQDHSMFPVKLKMSPTNKCCKSCISCYMECGLPVDKNSCLRLRPYRSRICDAVGYVIRMICWFAKILKVCGRNKNAWYVSFHMTSQHERKLHGKVYEDLSFNISIIHLIFFIETVSWWCLCMPFNSGLFFLVKKNTSNYLFDVVKSILWY